MLTDLAIFGEECGEGVCMIKLWIERRYVQL